MSNDPVTPKVVLHNLQSGRSFMVARPELLESMQGPVADALIRSEGTSDEFAPINGTTFGVCARFARSAPGSAVFWLGASVPLAGGEVPPGEILYSGAVASHLATAPIP